MSLIISPPRAAESNAKPDLATAVKHMAGLLWFEMLSELNQSGLGTDTLGTGGDDFQSMFLWNVAQNDFGKYDSALATAALHQVGGQPNLAPTTTMPDLPVPFLQAMQLNNTTDAGAIASSAPPENAPLGNLLSQAKNFAKSIWPQLTAAAQILGVPAVAVLAQTALETGWGAAAPGNNLFGIKAVDGEPSTARATHEMIDGVLTPQTANFRDYASTAGSISDYINLIQSFYPTASGQHSVAGFAQALQQGGYATDINYANKILQISQSPLMAQVLQSLPALSTSSQPPAKSKGAS